MSNIAVDPLKRIKMLSDTLEQEGFGSVTELITAFRSEKSLLAELPSVFEAALESILERMESTALFAEESCSFSQNDMVDALADWLSHAQRL